MAKAKEWTLQEHNLLEDLLEAEKDIFWIMRAFEGKRSKWYLIGKIRVIAGEIGYRKGKPFSHAEDTYIKNAKVQWASMGAILGRTETEVRQRQEELKETKVSTIVIPRPEEPSSPYWHITSTMIQRGRDKPTFFQRMFLKLAGVEWRGYQA